MKFSAAQLAICLTALASAVEAKNRIVMYTTKSLVTARIDPIVASGRISQHSHHVVGGSGFNSVYDPVKLRQSKCSNLGVQADKSNYWAPQVFRVLSNGSYVGMHTNTRIYYSQPQVAGNATVEPFPFDFQMIAGNPARKTITPENQADISTFYYCEIDGPNGSITGFESYTLPTRACSILVAKVFMPTCWNGQSYDPENPYAHVKYPLFGGGIWGANCPVGYERRLPSILVETYYFNADQPKTNPKQMQYILANGDTTGLGLHADFANGWDMPTLTKMVNECKQNDIEEPANLACVALAPSLDQGAADNCQFEGQIPDEQVGFNGPLRYLPGCNMPWPASMASKPNCNPKVYRGDPKWITPAPGTIWP